MLRKIAARVKSCIETETIKLFFAKTNLAVGSGPREHFIFERVREIMANAPHYLGTLISKAAGI
jgi:hypothetical protein